MKKIFFLNFGHASTPLAGDEGLEVVRINNSVPNLKDPSDPKEVGEVVQSLIQGAGEELRRAVNDGETVVIGLPGASSVAVTIVAVTQGLLGYFPKTLAGSKKETGSFVYDLGKVFDLNQARETGRGLRGKFGI